MSEKSKVVSEKNSISYKKILALTMVYSVPLGILMKNENVAAEMVDILVSLHQYVPQVEIDSIVQVSRMFRSRQCQGTNPS